MPALPNVLAQSRGAIVSTPNVQVQTGAIAGNLGKAADDVSRLAARIDAQSEKDARISSSLKDAQIQLRIHKAASEREASGEPLDNYASWLETTTNEAYDTLIGDASNDYERTNLTMMKADALGRAVTRGIETQQKYVIGKKSSDLETLGDDLARVAFLDPMSAPEQAAKFRFALEGSDLPFDVRDKFKDMEGKITATGVAAMIEQNPYAGAGMVQDYVKRGMIGADEALVLSNRADAGIKSKEAEAKQRANEARAAQSEAARLALEGADDALAYVAEGNVPTPEILNNYSPERILALTGSEKAAKKAADAFTRGEGMRELLNAGTPTERAKVIDQASAAADDPENFKFNQDTLRIYQSVNADLNDKLAKDPGGVAEMSMRVQEAIASGDGSKIVAASYAEQERQGVPSFYRKPLSNAYAAQLGDQIAALPPEEQGKALQELQASYGASWPDVMQQIGTKLPPALAVASVLPRNPDGSANRAATTLASVAGLKMEDLTAGLEKGAKGDVEEAILADDRMQSLNRMLGGQVGGRETFAQYQDSVTRLALTYVGAGKSIDDAVAMASQEVTSDTDFREVDNSMVGIPVAANPDMVEAGMRAAVSSIDVSKLDLPANANEADARAALASNLSRNAEWVPDGKGKGLYLRVIGEPVTVGGEPVFFSWEELKSAALPQGGFMFEGQR